MFHVGYLRAFFVSAVLASLIGTEAHAESRVRIAVQGDIARLDPHVLNETLTLGVLSNVMEGLVGGTRNCASSLGLPPIGRHSRHDTGDFISGGA